MRSVPALLQGKRILVTGVLTDDSLAYGVAELAQREGAEVVLTSAGRALSLTRRVAKHLPAPPDVLELDVTVPEHIETVAAELQGRWGGSTASSTPSGSRPRPAWAGASWTLRGKMYEWRWRSRPTRSSR